MADVQIALLNADASPDEADVFAYDDVSAPETQKITLADLRLAILNHATSLVFKSAATTRLTISTTTITSTLPILYPNGTAGAPAGAASGDTDTGFYWTGTANEFAVSTGGTGRVKWTTTSQEPLTDNAISLGVSGKRWSDGWFTQTHVGDLIMHDPDRGPAHWVLREGLDEIYAFNKRTGKAYRLAMVEDEDGVL